MPKKRKGQPRPKDVNELAHELVRLSTGGPLTGDLAKIAPSLLSDYMAVIGRKGGKIGGKRRMETMTPEERSKVARTAAKARWENK
jgi:hypothetical protein